MENDPRDWKNLMNCPNNCGKCCSLWHNVVDILKKYPNRPKTDPCPYLEAEGCKLPVEERPLDCTSYLCTVGAVKRLLTFKEPGEEVTLREALADLEHRMWSQWTTFMLSNLTEEHITRWRRWAASNFLELKPEETISDYAWANKMIDMVHFFTSKERQNPNG